MPAPTASPSVSSTVGLKNMVIAPLTEDTEKVPPTVPCRPSPGQSRPPSPPRAPIRTSSTPMITSSTPSIPTPRSLFSTSMADIPLAIQEMIFGNAIDDNGVLVRTSTDKPPYFAVGFMSEKANHKFRYVWLYKVRAKPMTETYKTKEGATITRQTAPSSGRPSSAPPMDAIRPWPMRARTALTLPRRRPSSERL